MGIVETGLGTHITINELPNPERKTRTWAVRSNYDGNGLLGRIAWFTRWRKYAFWPETGCIFEQVCMREISDFIETHTKRQRGK
jgi:hypothetical protein